MNRNSFLSQSTFIKV